MSRSVVLAAIVCMGPLGPVYGQPVDAGSEERIRVQYADLADSIQAQVVGHVLSADTGEPLATAQVFFEDSNVGTLTKETGGFALTPPTEGTLLLRVRRLGYVADSVRVESKSGRIAQVLVTLPRAQIEVIH